MVNRVQMSLPFSQAAISTLDQRVLSKMKRLNVLKHTTQTYQRHLEEMKMEYQRMKPEGSSGAQSADVRARKREEDAMVVTSGSRRDQQNMIIVTVIFTWCSLDALR